MKRLFFLAVTVLSACSTLPKSGEIVMSPARDWRVVATPNDRERLRDWRGAFVDGLREARAAGHHADIAREGALLQPDAALGGGPIPDGTYRCRVTKLGSKSDGLLPYIAYPAFACRITADGPLQSFTKLTGSQRQSGRIYPGDTMRQVFLGTLILGDEAQSLQYGRDQERDVAGFVERIGPARWRLIMPRPHFESDIDVLELVPAA